MAESGSCNSQHESWTKWKPSHLSFSVVFQWLTKYTNNICSKIIGSKSKGFISNGYTKLPRYCELSFQGEERKSKIKTASKNKQTKRSTPYCYPVCEIMTAGSWEWARCRPPPLTERALQGELGSEASPEKLKAIMPRVNKTPKSEIMLCLRSGMLRFAIAPHVLCLSKCACLVPPPSLV